MIYTKMVNDRQVFSACKSIQMQDGSGISNPSAEQIAEAGGEEYIPPVVQPTPQEEPTYNEILNAVKTMLSSSVNNLTDEDALSVAALYPTGSSKSGQTVTVGERLGYDGKLYKVIQSHTVQSDGTPDAATSLYTEVSIEEWPEFVQPTGSHDAYQTGDKVTYNGIHYTSLIDGNIGDPITYPAGGQQE